MQHLRAKDTRPVSAPRKPLPPGAWDTHAHVFGPFDRFPLTPATPYPVPLAPFVDYSDMLATVGFDHGVLIHGVAHGYDTSALVDALEQAAGKVTGVIARRSDVTDDELERAHATGVRGMRVMANGLGYVEGTMSFEDADLLAPRLKALNWQLHIWALTDLAVANAARIQGYGLPVIFDHMGFFDAARGVDDPAWRSFVAMLRDSDFYVKLTPHRVSQQFPDYEDVRPFHDQLIEAIPDRLVFGSDWPFLGMDDKLVDVGRYVDLFDAWTDDDGLRQKIFVNNPAQFFGEQ